MILLDHHGCDLCIWISCSVFWSTKHQGCREYTNLIERSELKTRRTSLPLHLQLYGWSGLDEDSFSPTWTWRWLDPLESSHPLGALFASLQDSRPRESATSYREVSSSQHLASAARLVWTPFGGMMGLFLFRLEMSNPRNCQCLGVPRNETLLYLCGSKWTCLLKWRYKIQKYLPKWWSNFWISGFHLKIFAQIPGLI